jgi:hypothetical protein
MHSRITLSLVFTMTAVASGQGTPGMPDGSRERAAMAPLARLVGQWEGDASAVIPTGETMVVRQFEDVVWGAGSTVLMVRGTGRSKDPDMAGQILYEAAATIWWDGATSKYKMRAHRAEGIAVEPEVEVRGDTLVWGFEVSGGRVRYTTVFSNTDWHEVGHFLRPGAPPVQMIDMRLRKVSK